MNSTPWTRLAAIGVAFGLAAGPGVAGTRLSAVFGDGMVLQRDIPIRIWGWAAPEEAIAVGFDGRSVSTPG